LCRDNRATGAGSDTSNPIAEWLSWSHANSRLRLAGKRGSVMAMHSEEKGSETDPTSSVTVLSVSPHADDHSVLRDFFLELTATQQPETKWLLKVALTIEGAIATLTEHSVAIVLCESNLSPGSWKDLLDHISAHPQPPLMIVTSRLADEYLWVEALHHGAYDVLRKPFELSELNRVITKAALKWTHQERSGEKRF